MHNPFQSGLPRPWQLACAAVLLGYASLPLARGGHIDFDAAPVWLDLVMFFFSFPLGTVVMLGLSEGGVGVLHRSQFWALALAFGYFQWFHLVPLIFRRRTEPVVTLNLAAGGGVASAAATPAAAQAALLHAAEAPPVPQFNERGRTPLERVFDDES